MSFGVFRIVCVANIALCTGDISIGPPMSLHMFALTTSLVLQTPPCVQPKVAFFFRHGFTCLAYLGGLSFDFCECFTLFNDEALNFLTFYTQTAKAVCDACTLLPCSPIDLQGGLGGTNETSGMRCNAEAVFHLCIMKNKHFSSKNSPSCVTYLNCEFAEKAVFLVFFAITRVRT